MSEDPFEILQKAELLSSRGNYREALVLLVRAEKAALENKRLDALAAIYFEFGNNLTNLGDLENAKEYLDFSLEISEQLAAEKSFYNNWDAEAQNNLGTLLSNMGRMDEAKSAFERALKISESLLETDPGSTVYQSDVAMTLNNLGALLTNMSRLEEAKPAYERALKMCELLLETDPGSMVYQSDVGLILNNLGILLRYMGRLNEAEPAYERALKMRKSLLETDPGSTVYQSNVATTLNNLGNLLRDMGRLDEAKPAFKHALNMYESLLETNPRSTVYQSQAATTLNDLGALLSDMGRLDEAKPAYERALKMRESLLETDPGSTVYQSHVAMTLRNLGALLLVTGRLDEAKSAFERALKMRELLLETEPGSTMYKSDVALTLNDLGALLYNMDRLDEAESKLERALNMYESLLETDPRSTVYQSDVALTLNNLGNLLSGMGRLDEAKPAYEHALKMRESLLETDPGSMMYQSQIASTLNNLGVLLQKYKKFSQALDYHTCALNHVSRSENPDLIFKIFWGRGRCHERIGNLEEAYEDYRDSIDQIEHIRSQFSLEQYKLDIMWDKEEAYSDIISFLCTKKEDVRRAWEYVGRAKSRTLLEYLRLIELPAPQSIPADIRKNEKTLLESIRILDRQARKSEKADQVYSISQEIKKTQDELDKLYIEIEKYAPDYVDLRKGLPLRFEGIKDLLNNQSKRTALIEYYTTREKVFIFVMQSKESQPEVRIIDLSYLFSWDDIPGNDNVRLIEFLKNKFGIDWLETATIEKIDNDRTIGLSFENNSLSLRLNDEKTKVNLKIDDVRTDEFIARTENGKLNIYDLSSNQLLEYVKKYFSEAVGYPEKPWIKQTWQELAEHLIAPVFEDIKGCEMLYIIPHGLLHYLPLHALYINGKYLIEHFPVIFAPAAATIKYAQEKGSGKLEACLSMGFTPYEEEKELFEGEAILVSSKFKEGTFSSMEPILDKNATRERLIKEAAGKDIIHLSCHGDFNQQEPLNSGLLLSDGWLIVKDIFGMSMDADLLALSACETGINEQKPGDELVGLTRAFLYTGTRSVMVTLWKVSPESTFILMDSFYEKLKDEKISKAKALQEIQVELMRLTAQEAIDYYEKIKTQLKGYEAFSTHRLIDRIIADTRLNAHDFKEALKEYKELLPGMDPQSDEYKQLKKNISKCQLALSSPEPADYDYGKHVYAHPYYWAPFVLVGDWR